MRAWSYENKLREGKGGEIARECLEEIRNRVKKGKAVKGLEEERVNFMEETGWKMEEIEGMWQQESLEERIYLKEKESCKEWKDGRRLTSRSIINGTSM